DVERLQEGIAYKQPTQLFVNLGDGTFEDRTAAVGGALAIPIVSRGLAYGDYDGDGDVDLLLTENDGPARLFRNDSAHGHRYARIHVRGVRSNRDGIGARLVAYAAGRPMERRVRTGA